MPIDVTKLQARLAANITRVGSVRVVFADAQIATGTQQPTDMERLYTDLGIRPKDTFSVLFPVSAFSGYPQPRATATINETTYQILRYQVDGVGVSVLYDFERARTQ